MKLNFDETVFDGDAISGDARSGDAHSGDAHSGVAHLETNCLFSELPLSGVVSSVELLLLWNCLFRGVAFTVGLPFLRGAAFCAGTGMAASSAGFAFEHAVGHVGTLWAP